MEDLKETIIIDRNQAKSDAERESKEADLKQHADKLVRGFENLDSSSANRAVWELVQNACDLSKECEVEVDYRNNAFAFSHNGKPFTSATLISLIKQVSNKYDGEDVGKFGTGFITTHAFGRIFTINSLLDVKGRFIKVKDFLIDRRSREWKGMVSSLIDQENQVYELINSGEISQGLDKTTTFKYLPESATEHDYIRDSKLTLHSYIPIVLTLNDRLVSVTVFDEYDPSQTYCKVEKKAVNDFYKTIISVGTELIEVFSLKDEEKGIEVVLPIGKNNEAIRFNSQIAKLFLFYPLIGTEQWGCNFIFHSKNFAPTEPRDGIHLKSKTEQVQENEENNRELIKAASEMIFSFIRNNIDSITHRINLAQINFNVLGEKPLLNDYFQELKSIWANEFKEFPLVETSSGPIKPSEAVFLDNELLQSDEYFDSIYALSSMFWNNLPLKHLIKDWTNVINEWNIANIRFLTIKELAIKISETGTMGAFEKDSYLIDFYRYIIEQQKSELFNYKLLPNIKGEFRQFVGLNSSINLPDILIQLADVIMPDIPKRHVHSDFKFNLEFTPYSRKNYATEINDHISKLVSEKATSESINREYFVKLLDYCKIVSFGDSSSIPSKIIKLICKHFDHNEELIVIPEIKDDILDVRMTQKRILKLFLNDLSKKDNIWVNENIDFLEDVISLGANYDTYDELFQTLAVFPNQLNELCVQSNLSIDDNIPEPIKELYDTVIKPKFSIRTNLVNPKFADYLKNGIKRSTRNLTEKIESEFFESYGHISLNDHPFKKEILQLIDDMKKSSLYEKFFPLLFSKRSTILVELADGEDTFSILSLDPTRIKSLAKLGNNPDFDEIVRLGKEALLAKQQEQANFQYKYAIGTYIENILRNSLIDVIPDNIMVEIKNEQNGQDIIIKFKDTPVYYIEVKSRWDINNPERMSKNQTLKAHEQRKNYALCSVDMTKYQGDNRTNVKNIEEIRDLIRVNTDIGDKVAHLIDVLNQTNELETINLDGDYRTRIPQKYIETGYSLNEFVFLLIAYLKTK